MINHLVAFGNNVFNAIRFIPMLAPNSITEDIESVRLKMLEKKDMFDANNESLLLR